MNVDVIVVGGGHAGVEAAAAACRRRARVALVTFDHQQIGTLSCNPSVGGVGKGHLVREVDAFGGIMGEAADAAAIHYRMLNRSKGKAVQGPRVQVDRVHYRRAVQDRLRHSRLTIVTDEVVGLALIGDRVRGVTLASGASIEAAAVVLATGTFLGGRIFRGEERSDGGRIGERAATVLGEQLERLGLPLGRLKTGTPPRLDGRTIDWAQLDVQPSDVDPWTMSPMGRRVLPQLFCATTRTNEQAHAMIRGALDRSPMFTGAIQAGGPRYCPSIEDKIHRFADRDGHQIFLEPEGLADHLIYPNGLSTSLPSEVQVQMIQAMPGLERCRVVVAGYAVEYRHVDPRCLRPTLGCREVGGLFMAGQINGTTGYEEAAGQGLVAGINAAAWACDLEALTLNRADSYLGVMVDDLVLQGITEPYRMLTARAEYRLRLRADNAESRLSSMAEALGCLPPPRIERLGRRDAAREILMTWSEMRSAGRTNAERVRAGEGVELPLHVADADLMEEVVEDLRYAPYLARQEVEVANLRGDEELVISDAFDFRSVPGLSNEMIERLERARPESLGAASRVRGITPAALSAILLQARR